MIKKIAIFASGNGTNFEAIDDAIKRKKLKAKIAILVSDNPQSRVVRIAKEKQIPVFAFNPKSYQNKSAYEKIICYYLINNQVDLIILAGYMRIVGSTLLNAFPRKIINIHPSLLPQFRGVDAIGQAFAARAIRTGVTIHYIDNGIDTGEIITQKKVKIHKNDSREVIEDRIHKIEHRLYPKTIKKLLEEIK